MRRLGDARRIELEVVESVDCTNNLEDIVTNLNLIDANLDKFSGVNSHLQKEKQHLHDEISKYRQTKTMELGTQYNLYSPFTTQQRNTVDECSVSRNKTAVNSILDFSRVIGAEQKTQSQIGWNLKTAPSESFARPTLPPKIVPSLGRHMKSKALGENPVEKNKSTGFFSPHQKRRKSIRYSTFLQKGKIVRIPVNEVNIYSKRGSEDKKSKVESAEESMGQSLLMRNSRLSYQKKRPKLGIKTQRVSAHAIQSPSCLGTPFKPVVSSVRNSVLLQYSKMRGIGQKKDETLSSSLSKVYSQSRFNRSNSKFYTRQM